MTTLNEMQFELLPTMDSEDGVVFGIGADVSVDDGGFDPGEDSWITQDASNPRRGGTNFGIDLLDGPTWAWSLHVDTIDVPTAVDALATFKSAWRAAQIRSTSGAVIPLRYALGGRVRRVYGRPRRFAAPPSNRILGGYVPITVDFKCADSYTYDDQGDGVLLGINSGSTGGLIFPTTFPTNVTPVGIHTTYGTVGGDAPTYPVVRFNGPVLNPSLATDDWTLSLSTSLLAGQWIEVDLRPWAISALRNDGSSAADALGRRTYLSDMKLEPGQHQFVLRGIDETNSATCAVTWANAWNSI